MKFVLASIALCIGFLAKIRESIAQSLRLLYLTPCRMILIALRM